MSDVTIYHNPRCSKSRETLALLREHGVEPMVVEYLKTPLDAAGLKALLKKLGASPRALIRSREAEYAELGLDNPSLTDEQLVAAIAATPKLMERPVVVKGAKAAIGRPPESVLAIL